MGTSGALEKVWRRAESYPAQIGEEEILRLSESKDARDRLLSLVLIQRQIERGADGRVYLPLARRMVSDAENNCRWQAAIVVGMSIESVPDEVWKVVREHGDSEDEDMRSAIATILLEHLLEFDFDRYFAFVRDEVSAGRLRQLDTLSMCAFSDDKINKEVGNYIRNATRGRPRE